MLNDLFQELSQIIKKHPIEACKVETPLHQQLNVVFNAPSLLVGCRIRHQFEDENETPSWYQGQIVSYRKQHYQVSYPDTDEKCDFTLSELKDDFYSGDLWFT